MLYYSDTVLIGVHRCCGADYFWDTLEMARKVVMTGMLMFVHRGSLVQVVVAMIISMGFLVAIALLEPYASRTANLFKVGAEVALVTSLMIVVMLKIDLSREDFDDPDLITSALGGLLILVNTALPTAGLCAGLLLYGADAIETVVDAVDHVVPDEAVPVDEVGAQTQTKTKKSKKGNKSSKKADDGQTFANPLEADD